MVTTAATALSLLQQSSARSGGFDFSFLTRAATGQGAIYSVASIPVALKQAEANEARQLAQVAKQPDVQKDIERYNKVVASAKSLDDILNDPVARKVLMKANGLGDQVDYVGLAKKAMMSDPDDPNSLANKLASVNSAWLNFVKTYDIRENGLEVLAPKQDGFAAKWKITVERGEGVAEAKLQLAKTPAGGWTATIDNVPAPVTVTGSNVSVTLFWKDAQNVIHTSLLEGKLSGATISGAQTDDGASTKGKWSAELYYADMAEGVSKNYVAEKRLDMLDQQLPGLGSAILFKQMAPGLNTAVKILGSALGRSVVTTALGLPKQLALQSIPTQLKAITQRIDPAKFSDPVYVDRLAQRYLSVLNGSSGGIIA